MLHTDAKDQAVMWDGVLSPSMVKHHMRARIRDRVSVDKDPITEEVFERPRQYYKVDVRWPPDTKVYVYLIPAPVVRETIHEVEEQKIEDILGQELTDEEVEHIMNAVKEYTKNPIPGGRDWRDYLTDEELQRQIDRGEAKDIFIALT